MLRLIRPVSARIPPGGRKHTVISKESLNQRIIADRSNKVLVIKSKEDYKEYRSSKQREQPEMERQKQTALRSP